MNSSRDSNHNQSKRFEAWEEEVDCQECERWWTNQCDAPNTHEKGSKTPCMSFLPNRRVVIPNQIKSLQRAFKWLFRAWVVSTVIFSILIILFVR